MTVRFGTSPRQPTVTHAAPHVRATQSVRGMMNLFVLALLPCLAMAIYNTGYQVNVAVAELGVPSVAGWRGDVAGAIGPGHDAGSPWSCIVHGAAQVLPILAVSLIVAGFWAWLFARLRRRPIGDDIVVTALVFTLILPPAAPLWQVAVGMSFGAVLAKEIFGGTGRNFVNPALAGLAFLFLAYPGALATDPVWTGVSGYGGSSIIGAVAAGGMRALDSAGLGWSQSFLGVEQGAMGVTSTLACLIGAAVLLAARVVSWRIMLGMLVGMFVTVYAFKLIGRGAGPIVELPWYWHLTLGGFAFGMVFLATDPVTAAATHPGRWIYGMLIGGMVVVVRVGNPLHPDGVMMAVLLGNVFAPLIDCGVMSRNIRRRASWSQAP